MLRHLVLGALFGVIFWGQAHVPMMVVSTDLTDGHLYAL